MQFCCRTPRGVRGLKFCNKKLVAKCVMSHPSRGAWIEIPRAFSANENARQSHPSRGAWIEIRSPRFERRAPPVAPLAGCVD